MAAELQPTYHLSYHLGTWRLGLDLSNFQNEYVCDTRTLIARPATVKDVQDAVRLHDHVKANGAGHSWNKPFFCANPDASSTKQAVVAQSGSGKSQSSSVNIMMTALRPLKIKVLEDEEAVLHASNSAHLSTAQLSTVQQRTSAYRTAEALMVDAGVITIDLLNYLSSYVTAKAPAGWTLTVGGAVSTGTHGSSLKWGTMSNQVLEVQMVVANGSLITLTPASHPFLMRAARVSVGKLGIITQLKMRIVREEPVTRRLRLMPASAFVTLMREVQTSAEQGSHPAWLNETEFFWLPQRSEFMMVSFTRGDAPDLATRQAVLASYVPQNTTVYQTSQQLLQDKSLQRVQDLPLKPVSFSAPGGLTKDAWAAAGEG
ncbi:FAD-binding PCMH-type domain-containing protein [Haematococcus lacustris]|uniref:FAD-binding PCMH-type domain-containing protein n=1 Tax=Haematococcus lacustris TaxID=44745 RepID=A0A699Y736_HAELA|nr:FAD-binding PCMH-type domain-containing protein [Haematococcus lacustris]